MKTITKIVRKKSLTCLWVLLVLFSSALKPQSAPEIKKLAINLYRITIDGINAVALIKNGEVLLSDNFKKTMTPQLIAEIRKLGGQKIRYMINTHLHHDHCGGNLNIKADAVIAHENVRKALSCDFISPFWQDTLKAFPENALPNLTFTDKMKLFFAGEEIELIHYPSGHSDGDVIVHFKNANVVHLGDLLFSIGFPAVDFERGGDVEHFAANLAQIIRIYPDDIVFVAGHGKEFCKAELMAYQSMLCETAAIVKQEMQKGTRLEEMKKKRILDRWLAYSHGYFSCDDWVEIIYASYQWKEKSGSRFEQ
ncbi:MBL fold metallo-hydrolase [candidate division KSB1 bacterium]|nr:MBL fold metallo-hydrolase [candidate division KSB1 bacterium]